MKQLIGKQFSLYIDNVKGILTIEDHLHIIEIEVSKILEIQPVVWNKKGGETFEDVAKKKPEKVEVFVKK